MHCSYPSKRRVIHLFSPLQATEHWHTCGFHFKVANIHIPIQRPEAGQSFMSEGDGGTPHAADCATISPGRLADRAAVIATELAGPTQARWLLHSGRGETRVVRSDAPPASTQHPGQDDGPDPIKVLLPS
ncbi:hypothetical protein AAFF_G00085760 [Aldrovandia affinis]|uniref:Uncharacterized protein n=1 Tax=Aldrovandia affinis TaxID=143900 RepID=A0AAD7RWY8_9TELE|nr:hypothetical protein AAFF_G00085760 [Aldrovandia affinis]